ncbi:MAG: hypothetical protein AB7L13_15020 [Acidimicrobiia bacterium]
MSRVRGRSARRNRAALAATSIVVLTLAALGTLISTGTVESLGTAGYRRLIDAKASLLTVSGQRLVDDHPLTLQLLALGAGAIMLALGLWWLRVQIPPLRHHDDVEVGNVHAEGYPGTNRVDGRALVNVLEADLERDAGIERARVDWNTDEELVRLRLDITDDAVPAEVINSAVAPAMRHALTVSELVTMPRIEIDLRPVSTQATRVA